MLSPIFTKGAHRYGLLLSFLLLARTGIGQSSQAIHRPDSQSSQVSNNSGSQSARAGHGPNSQAPRPSAASPGSNGQNIHVGPGQNQPDRLTVEKIMQDPKWIGASPSAPYWSLDGKYLFFNWNPDKALSDSAYYITPENHHPHKAPFSLQHNLVAAEAVSYNTARTAAAYTRDGDIFWTDSRSGKETRITNTVDKESDPVFAFHDRQIAYTRNSNLYAWDLSTGLTTQLTNFQRTAEPSKDDKKESGNAQERWLQNDQLQQFDVLKTRKTRRDRNDSILLARQPKALKSIFIDDKFLSNITISPDGRFITYRLTKRAAGARNTIVPSYVTESGFTQDIPGRTKVGSPQGSSCFFVYDTQKDTVIAVTTNQIPGITDLPDYVRDYPSKTAAGTKTLSGSTRSPGSTRSSGSASSSGVIASSGSATSSGLKSSSDSTSGLSQNSPATKEVSDPKTSPDSATYSGTKASPRPVLINGPEWSEQGAHAIVDIRSQDNKDRWLMLLDAATGKLKLLDRQRDEAWIGGPGIGYFGEAAQGWIDENTFWYQSEASGYSHLYKVDVTTGEKSALTSGHYEVLHAALSNNKKYFYITTNEADPEEQQFYRLPLSGGKAERITTLTGASEVVLSPDEKQIAFLYSYTNKPWELYLQDNKPGSQPQPITTLARSEQFNAYPWRDPSLITFTASDGALVHARLYRPAINSAGSSVVANPAASGNTSGITNVATATGFTAVSPGATGTTQSVTGASSTATGTTVTGTSTTGTSATGTTATATSATGAAPTHPAVIFVHGAGYLQNAHKWWSYYFREYMFNNLLADNGYTVLDIDYRGSAGYGRDWRTGIYRHMGGKDLSDQVDGVKYLVEHEGVDPKRIGIYGGSYGGFITLMALFTEPDVFAAGAGLRSVTDWAHYNHGYTSAILNEPYNDSLAYRRSSPIYFAEGLKGHLLLCHGMVDENVHFQDIVRLTQRLIELGKNNWELAVYPVEDHGFVEPSSWTDEYKRIFRLFETYLKP